MAGIGPFDTIRYELRQGLALITLARPEKRNAMSLAMFDELAAAAEAAVADRQVRGVLLSADGPSFCAGIDLGELAGLAGAGAPDIVRFARRAQRPFGALAGMAKPSVAAVCGHALGAGFQLALACDLRVAAEDASFAMLEARYGLVPDLGGPHHLVRLVGPARAKELVWTARTVGASEALALGRVDRMAAKAALEAEGERLAREVTAHSPVAVGLAKSLIDRGSETPMETAFERQAEAQGVCVSSQDHREAMAAAAERREARYAGR